MAEQQDIPTVYRGEDVNFVFTMTPLTDITGWTNSWRLKASFNDATVLLSINATLTTPASGIFTVALTAAQTTAIPAGNYVFDVWRTDSGSSAALAIGNLVVKGSVRIP